jgi:hypoxanthine phosphoribosyltransferase
LVNWHPAEAYGELADDVRQVLIPAEEIEARVLELGQAISEDYAGRNPLLVGVLKGVVIFMADLLRAITIPVEVDFLAVSSYTPELRDQGVVRLMKDLEAPITGRHVLFVEDVIDTGFTLHYLLNTLRARQPASLEVVVLFDKPDRRLVDTPLKYCGFELPEPYVVGCGLDFRERYRNLPFVGLLKPEALHRPGDQERGPK